MMSSHRDASRASATKPPIDLPNQDMIRAGQPMPLRDTGLHVVLLVIQMPEEEDGTAHFSMIM
jgi:hypothetical protein